MTLPQPVPLEPDSYFSVVVTVRGDGAPVLRLSQDPSGAGYRYSDGHWSKLNQAVRIKALTVQGEAEVPPEPTPTPTRTVCEFTDVRDGDYFYNAILWAAEQKIAAGVSVEAFCPENNCTRGQMVMFLYRLLGG